jgi:hypothetical protein
MNKPPIHIRWPMLLLPLIFSACTEHAATFDEISWQGEKYKLARSFRDWEDYKKAEDQLAPAEAERVFKKVTGIPVPSRFSSIEELIKTMPKLNFPGYGHSVDGSVRDSSGRRYRLSEYEIPLAAKRRALLYREEKDGSCILLLDEVFENRDVEQSVEFHMNKKTLVEDGMLRVYVNGKVHRESKLKSAV